MTTMPGSNVLENLIQVYFTSIHSDTQRYFFSEVLYGLGAIPLVECLSSMCKALGSVLSILNKQPYSKAV
jgi:hypothetical protein